MQSSGLKRRKVKKKKARKNVSLSNNGILNEPLNFEDAIDEFDIKVGPLSRSPEPQKKRRLLPKSTIQLKLLRKE